MAGLRFEHHGDIGWLWLTRPERLNAQTLALWYELGELQRGIDALDPPLRCLVVAGEGRAFSAGIDLAEIQPPDGSLIAKAAEDRREWIAEIQGIFRWFRAAPFPTLAAVHGHALGVGLQLALACDVRLFAQGTQAGLLEFRRGLLPDLGGTVWLPAVVGDGIARELIFTGRKVDAEEAARIGLANWVVPPAALLGDAAALAAVLADAPPLACAHTKAAMLAGDEDSHFALVGQGQAECLQTLLPTERETLPPSEVLLGT